MENKDKRSIILSLLLGDGCLHNVRVGKNTYSKLCIDHGMKQADYHAWKARLVSDIIGREINVRKNPSNNCVTFQVWWKRMRSWRRFIYKDNKKSLPRILPFITNPMFALSLWLMDDGYCEPSISTLATGEKVNYGVRFRIFTNSQTLEQQEFIVDWFKKNIEVDLLIKKQHYKNTGKTQYFLKFSQKDTLLVWEKIRDFVLQFKSMQYKFRYAEQIYQKKKSQRTPDSDNAIG